MAEQPQSQSQPRKPAEPGLPLTTKVKIVIGFVIALLAIIVAFQNTDTVTTRVLFWHVPMPHALLLILTFAAGAVVGMLAMTMYRRRHRRP